MPTHDTGVWLTDDGDVVYEQPRGRATQLVAPGGEVSAAVRSRLEAHGLDDVDLPDEEEAAQEPEEVEAVKSEDLQPKPARKAPAKKAAAAKKSK